MFCNFIHTLSLVISLSKHISPSVLLRLHLAAQNLTLLINSYSTVTLKLAQIFSLNTNMEFFPGNHYSLCHCAFQMSQSDHGPIVPGPVQNVIRASSCSEEITVQSHDLKTLMHTLKSLELFTCIKKKAQSVYRISS